MALIPIPCTENTIVVETAPPLVSNPPVIDLAGDHGRPQINKAVFFDFSPLWDLGRSAKIRYFTYQVNCASHGVAMFDDLWLNIDVPGGFYLWPSGSHLHTPGPYFIIEPRRAGQDMDEESHAFLPTVVVDSAGFTWVQFFAQFQLGAIDFGIPILGRCGLIPASFGITLAFGYDYFLPGNFAYTDRLVFPVVQIDNLTAWCEVTEPWNCTDPCTPSVIASGHSGEVCLQAKFVKDSALPADGFAVTVGQHAPLTYDMVDTSACQVRVLVGCLTAEQIAANHFAGPYTINFVSADHCTFDNVPYTRVYTGHFRVTADAECVETDTKGKTNPFNLEDAAGRYHTTSLSTSGIVYARSNFGTNAVLGWAVSSTIPHPSGHSLHDPRVIVDHRQSVWLSYARQVTISGAWDGAFVAKSNDDGASWEAAVLAIPSGKHPTIAIGTDGTFDTVVVAAYVGPDGGPGVITARVQGAGDAALGTAFNFKDDAGADLSVKDDTFHIQQARDDQSRWMLHVRANADGFTSQWVSYDECKTWKKVV